MMKKITDEEENEMYRLLAESLFEFVESKPKLPIEFLSGNLVKRIGYDQNSKASGSPTTSKINQSMEVSLLKNSQQNAIPRVFTNSNKIFSNEYKIIKKIGFGSLGDVFLAEEKINPGTMILKRKQKNCKNNQKIV